MNNLIILIIFLILIIICKNNIKEKFSVAKNGFKIWSCQNNKNGYCYNLSRSNFNKSDWKSPEWNNSFNSINSKLKTVYHNPAYKYPECEDWLKDPANVEISNECLQNINKKIIKKQGNKIIIDETEDDEGNKRTVVVEQKSGGFTQYCANRDKNYYDCDKYNYHSGDKKYIGFGNDEDKIEEERKKDFLKFCRRFGDLDMTYWNNLSDGKIIPSNINRFEPSNDAGSFPTKVIDDVSCVKKLCKNDNNCKFDLNKKICVRDYDDSNKIHKYSRNYRCNDSNNLINVYFKDIYELQEKIKNKNITVQTGLDWNSTSSIFKNNINI